MNKFRKWLIHKLGGNVDERSWCSFISDYWDQENVSETLYVPKEYYTDAAKNDIERELAAKIGAELLRRDLLFFSANPIFADHGDVPVYCSINVLKLKNRTPGHMPPHLKKGDDTMNGQTT